MPSNDARIEELAHEVAEAIKFEGTPARTSIISEALRTAELEEARKQLAAANAKTLELAQQLHREQVRASRANPFVDRD